MRTNVKISEANVRLPSELTMAEHLSTMENVIVNTNRVQLQSSTNGATHSGTSSGQTDCTINSNHSHFDAENIVSSTQETTNDNLSDEKLNSARTIGSINKCDEMSGGVAAKLALPKALAIEKHINSADDSHVHKTNTLSSQSRKPMDESKHHLHNTESSKIKSKDSNGSYHIRGYGKFIEFRNMK